MNMMVIWVCVIVYFIIKELAFKYYLRDIDVKIEVLYYMVLQTIDP